MGPTRRLHFLLFIDEARKDIPRCTQLVTEYQEQTLQLSREIADTYLDSQKQIMKSFQWRDGVWKKAQADALRATVGSPYEKINSFVLHVNQELAKGSNAQTIHKLSTEIEDQLEEQEMLQTGSPTGSPNATGSGIK